MGEARLHAGRQGAVRRRRLPVPRCSRCSPCSAMFSRARPPGYRGWSAGWAAWAMDITGRATGRRRARQQGAARDDGRNRVRRDAPAGGREKRRLLDGRDGARAVSRKQRRRRTASKRGLLGTIHETRLRGVLLAARARRRRKKRRDPTGCTGPGLGRRACGGGARTGALLDPFWGSTLNSPSALHTSRGRDGADPTGGGQRPRFWGGGLRGFGGGVNH